MLDLVGMLVIVAALATVFWLARMFFAPSLFFALWQGPKSPLAPAALVILAPLLIALPFGIAFGALPWPRPLAIALLVGLFVAGLNVGHAAWAGVDFFGPRGWITPIEALLFVVLFACAAYGSAHLWLRSGQSTRLTLGVTMLSLFTLVAYGGAYWSYRNILASAGAA